MPKPISPGGVGLMYLKQLEWSRAINATAWDRNSGLEICMTRYIARFMKDVLGDNGHQSEICQRFVEVEAPSKRKAAELAKVKFCEVEGVSDWALHADRVNIVEAEFPS